MKLDKSNLCPVCDSSSIKIHKVYSTRYNGPRHIYECESCSKLFSETWGTPMSHLNTPISKVSSVFRIRSEGMALRACSRAFGMNKSTITKGELKFAKQKAPLMLYALCHQFIKLTFEGDELYTVVGKRGEASHSEGWTAVIMDRASRFIVEQRCGKKDQKMFDNIMKTVVDYITNSQDFTFLSDGERRYGNTLYDLCARELRRKQRGRPPKTLPKGVKVRLKNKGSQAHKRGPKRPKYEAPQPEHPETIQDLHSSDIHANHIEAQNAALRRRNSAYRRRTNTYAKSKEALQRTLDVHQIIHNFVRKHWTTGVVPSVAFGITKASLSLNDVLTQRFA